MDTFEGGRSGETHACVYVREYDRRYRQAPIVYIDGGCQGADWFFKRISSLTVSKTTANIPIKLAEALSENPASAQSFRSCQSQLVLLRFPTIRKTILKENNPPIRIQSFMSESMPHNGPAYVRACPVTTTTTQSASVKS